MGDRRDLSVTRRRTIHHNISPCPTPHFRPTTSPIDEDRAPAKYLTVIWSSEKVNMAEFFSKQNVNGIIIPSSLLVVGTLIVKKEWAPWACLLAAIMSGWKLFSTRAKPVLKPTEFQDFELTEKTIISHNVAIYRFKLPTETSILGLPIGQHISISANIKQADGTSKEIVRSYTPNMVRAFAMIAGGTGITPMLQIIRAVIRGRPTGDVTKIDLIFANVNQEDILLKEDLDHLASKDENFNVYYVLNNPPEKWDGGVGFVTPEMMTKWLPKPASDVKLLLCGPPPMISAMKKNAEGLGFAKARPVAKLEDQVFAF